MWESHVNISTLNLIFNIFPKSALPRPKPARHIPTAHGVFVQTTHLKQSIAALLIFGFTLFQAGLGFAAEELPDAADELPSAEEAKKPQESTLLPAVVVTASRVEEKLQDIPMSVSVVGKQTIEDHPSVEVAEQLVNAPGVTYSAGKTGAGNNSMISIRGLEAGRVLYLIDGVRQNSIFKEDMNKGLMNIDPDDIERVEIIKGPASALYGSDAIGGVVNIITKKGGNGKPIAGKAKVIFDGSTYGIAPRLSMYGDYDGFSYRFSGNYVNANDRELVDGGRADHSAYHAESFFGQFGWKWDKGNVNFTAQHYNSDVQEMSAIYSWDDKRMILYDQKDPRVYYLSDFPRNERNTYTGALVLDDVSDNLKKLTVSSFYQFRDVIQRGTDANGATFASNRLQDVSHSYGGTLQTDWTFFDSHALTVGMEVLYDKLLNHSITATNAPEYSFDAHQRTIALFLQDEWFLTDDLSLVGGLRQSWIHTSLDKFEADPNREDAVSESSLVGNVGLVYKGFENLALRAQYSQGFRTPDLASQFTGTGLYLEPNTNLKPEKSQNYEIGARWNSENLTVDTSLFYNEITDMMTTRVIGYIPLTTWSINETINAATYESFGWELDAAWHIKGTGFTPYGSITLMKTRLEHENYTTNDNRVPTAWGTLGLKWEHTFDEESRLFTDVSYRMSAPYKYDGGDDQIWYAHEAGQTADLTIGLELGKERQFKGTLSIKNVFNREYEPDYYYYPGVHVVAGLSYEF